MSKTSLHGALALTVLAILAGCGKQETAAPAAAANPPPAAAPAAMPEDHPSVKPAAEVDLAGIAKADAGLTVAELFDRKAELSGKPVLVRGKVVKVAANIMDRDWVHVRDGSGAEGKNDLTVTTKSTPRAKVGDLVLVKGVVTTDKDLGMGYKYDVLIEDGDVQVEQPAG